MIDTTSNRPVRHLLGLSGGKDSSALAIYLRDKIPEMEYFFADTGAELPETLAYIDLLEDYLGKPIARLNSERDFEYYLKYHNNYLPSAQQRWCTVNLKLIPFEVFAGNDEVISYIAIRADEPSRSGYVSKKSNIKTSMPFRDDGINKEDVFDILESSGLGVPKYYDWRSRSGCYFCFFQKKEEWLGLKKHHVELFEKAKKYESIDEKTGRIFTWNQIGSLDEVIKRAEADQTKVERKNKKTVPKKLIDAFCDEPKDTEDACLICTL
ncbi:phosphoadenosine phosphosulfate reductase [Chromatium weissei]|nr:phosphoadenosine phosphosulfate reductase [Chromatium weissei]